MKKVQIEFDELPFPALERFGLTREMIEDLPMRVLDDICNGRHSPVLPVRVTDEHGGQIESRSRFAFIRMDNGQVDVVFYPALKSSPLERYDEAQQKQLLDGKAIVADVEMADGRNSKAFVQIDTETKQVMYVPTPIIARNLKVLAEVMRLGAVEVNGMQHGEPLTVVVDGEWDKYTFGCYGCWVMDDDGNLDYVSEEDYTEELWNEQKKSGERNRAAALHK